VSSGFSILAGTANQPLAAAIASELGVILNPCITGRFPDGEVEVHLLEPVRRKEVFLVQPTAPPVNDNLVELLALSDACRRAAAGRITAIVPYFGYARADKRHGRRESITGRLVADLLQAVGIAHVVTVDLHTPQLEGFFYVPVDSLTAVPTMCRSLCDQLSDDAVVVSTDVGRMHMAAHYAECLGLPAVVLHKRRQSGVDTEVTHVVGDVFNRPCLIVDDIISTGSTIAGAIKAVLEAGAQSEIIVAATHGLLLPGAREKLNHPAVRQVFVTDTVQVDEKDCPKLKVISVAPLIASAMQRFLSDGSIRELYQERCHAMATRQKGEI
jgi:ribose-phosphate pyrophosphokinase